MSSHRDRISFSSFWSTLAADPGVVGSSSAHIRARRELKTARKGHLGERSEAPAASGRQVTGNRPAFFGKGDEDILPVPQPVEANRRSADRSCGTRRLRSASSHVAGAPWWRLDHLGICSMIPWRWSRRVEGEVSPAPGMRNGTRENALKPGSGRDRTHRPRDARTNLAAAGQSVEVWGGRGWRRPSQARELPRREHGPSQVAEHFDQG